jgi:hypothetical protein
MHSHPEWMLTIHLTQKAPSRLSHHTSQMSLELNLEVCGGEQDLIISK